MTIAMVAYKRGVTFAVKDGDTFNWDASVMEVELLAAKCAGDRGFWSSIDGFGVRFSPDALVDSVFDDLMRQIRRTIIAHGYEVESYGKWEDDDAGS